MTREEAIKMAKADLKCMKRDTSGQDEMCNSHKCDECSLNYERGNMGEQKEWLRLAIEALEQKPCEDAVSRYDAIRIVQHNNPPKSIEKLRNLPSVTPTNVLDKIRAEIEQNAYPIVHGVNNHELGMTLYGILQIIDKYKAESEKA